MKTKTPYGFLLLFSLQLLACAPGKEKKQLPSYSRTQLEEDLNYLHEQILANHPGAKWYSNENDYKQLKNIVSDHIKNGMNEAEFLGEIAQYNDVLHCVHSDIRPSETYQQLLDTAGFYIPFNIRKSGLRYYICQNLSDSPDLDQYPEIISINGESTSWIVDDLFPYIPADGKNGTYKYHALTKQFGKYLSLYKFPMTDTYQVKYITDSGDTSTVELKGISKANFLQRRNTRFPRNDDPILFRLVEDSIGLLTISSFRNDLMEKHNINYNNFLDEVFEKLNSTGINHLIIDLRDNGGGYSEYAFELLTYLTDSTFSYCKKLMVNHDSVKPQINYDIPETFNGFPAGLQPEDDHFIWTKHSILGPRNPKPNAFKGRVLFVINGGCASTTSELASVAHHLKVGQFLGEEVGGSYRGDCGGVLGWITLPNTGIRVRLALVGYELAVGQAFDGHGVQPDFYCHPAIEVYRKKDQTVLNMALNTIKYTKDPSE